jgi:hypothetical protein
VVLAATYPHGLQGLTVMQPNERPWALAFLLLAGMLLFCQCQGSAFATDHAGTADVVRALDRLNATLKRQGRCR